MKLKGHSDFKLELIADFNRYMVKKSGKSRLIKQYEKQREMKTLIEKNQELSYLFEVPSVIMAEQGSEYQECYFTMPFYNGKNILDVLEYGDITELDSLIHKLFIYLNWELDNSKDWDVKNAIITKLYDIKGKINDPKITEIIKSLLGIVELSSDVTVPVGICHGDFTFSNMIFTNKIILIDFLDSFVESPIQDIAKILQELRLKWTLLMDNPKERDLTKIKIGYNYLYKEIYEILHALYEEYLPVIELFYMITLLRIIPYTSKDSAIYDILTKEIERVYDENFGSPYSR